MAKQGQRCVFAMAAIACCFGGLLGAQWQGHGGLGSGAAPSQALVRFTGFLTLAPHVVVACLLSWGITRMGCSTGKATLGPNAKLALFHDGNALVGIALAVALHGSGAAWPLLFAVAGRLLVGTCQSLRLRRSVAAAAVWAYAGAALLLNAASEGAGATYWCTTLLGAGAERFLPAALALDRWSGLAPAHFTVGIAFRYTLMRFVSWALDTLDGRVSEATSAAVVSRAYPATTLPATTHPASTHASSTHMGDAADAAESPRIGAVGGTRTAGAGGGASFDHLWSTPESPQKVHAVSTAGLASATWPAFLSYTLFAPLYLTGPILTAADFYQQAAASAAGRRTAPTLTDGALWRSVARLAGFCVFAEAARRTLLVDGVAQALLAAQPWHSWTITMCLLTALFAQSFVPWTAAGLLAGMLGINTPDEAPVGFLRSSVTPSTFWRNFHTSWYLWLRQYVYIPLGGTPAALVLTMAASTLLHSIHSAWLTWGAIHCAALLCERLRARRGYSLLPGLNPHLRTALVQCATQTTLLVQLPLGPNLWHFLACFHAVNLPFCALNAARLAGRRDIKSAKGGASMAQSGVDRVAAKLAAGPKVALD